MITPKSNLFIYFQKTVIFPQKKL